MAKDKGRKEVEKKATALKKLTVEYVPVGDLKPNAYNPNRQSDHDFELLMRSMREDGFTQPIVALPDLTIVDGEHRWRAAEKLGMKTVPIVKVEMTPEQMRIATLRHNRARGSEDVELAADVLRDLQELGALDWAQDSLMLSDSEINKLLEDISSPEALADDEYGEAWEPSSELDPDVEAKEVMGGHGVAIRSASTREAADAVRAREKRLKEAKSEEEREQIKREVKLYRVSLMFRDEEGEVVKEILGDRPAERLLELCQAEKERMAAA